MSSKHVRLVSEERLYAEGNLLQVQLDIINAVNRLKIFKLLRQEEATRKIELKNKFTELKKEFENLESLLPKVSFHEEKEIKKPLEPQVKTHKERFELEDEVEEIRRKIKEIQKSFSEQ